MRISQKLHLKGGEIIGSNSPWLEGRDILVKRYRAGTALCNY
jgi:hypothetical protein